MKRNKLYSGAVALVLCVNIGAEQADQQHSKPSVVTKKAKRPSPSRVKEKIGDSYGRLLKHQATIIEQMAQGNKLLADRTQELVCDDCDATLKQLEQYHDTLAHFENDLLAFEQRSRKMLDCLYAGLPQASKT